MLTRQIIGKGSFILLLSLLFAQSAFAIDEWYKALPLLGSLGQIKKDSVITVQDDVFFNPSLKPNQTTYGVKNFFSIKINEASGVLLPSNFSITVHFKLIATKVDGSGNQYIDSTSYSTGYPYVLANYNKTAVYNSNSTWTYSGAYRAKLRITSIDTMAGVPFSSYAAALVIENEMLVSREYNFSCTSNVIATVNTDTSYLASQGELRASWTKDKMADEYDLEWAYVDDSAVASYKKIVGGSTVWDSAKIFSNNATRVSIAQEQYFIPMIYDSKGYLFYRVRPVQIKYSGQRVEALWSSNYTAGLGSYHYSGHEVSLNWQANTSFAEEGKRKTVVQYFDGSLRSRQTVTKDNTTNTTVVSETMYDKQGRPVIQVLPAPTLSTVIGYTRNFNKGLNGIAYEKSSYDSIADPSLYCNASAPGMDSSSGASMYYSAANPQKDTGNNRYIPNAATYPFAETEYMPDNTGRIRQQGGVGAAFRLNSGHQTTYYYGTPDQKELDAMFGSEAGDYSHYFKTMVKDANGQFSVSYTDMHGRTVATALAGALPTDIVMDTLTSRTTRSITESLVTPSSNVIKDLVMESKKGLLVAKPGVHTFNYQLNPQLLQKQDCNAKNICYNCLYDLEIKITDDCNNQRLGGQPFDTILHNFSLAAIDTTCASATAFSFSFNRWLDPGSYEITKTLSVSRYGMDYYRDSIFVRTNTCRTPNSYVAEQRTLLAAILQCKPTCQQCTDSLGTLTDFSTRFKAKAGIDSGDTSYNGLIQQAYSKAQSDCNILCDKKSEYDDIRAAMLMDLTPPSGQYANPDSLQDKYSIFYFQSKKQGNDTIADYRKPAFYLDESGNRDSVYDEQAGVLVNPRYLSRDAFAQKFKLSWAESLLPYHPEYCKLQQYEALKTSHEWDRRFQATDSYVAAMQKGYLNPTSNTGTTPFSTYNATVSADVDPITSFAGHNYKTDLESALTQFRSISGSPDTIVSLWAFATSTVKCTGQGNNCMSKYYRIDSAFNGHMCTADLDMAWRTFRELYLNLKKELIDAQLKLSPCAATPSGADLTTAHHQPYFADATELFTANGSPLPTSTSQAATQATNNLNTYYDSNCRAYVQMWWEQLAPCQYTSADTAIIMKRLIQVCKEGSDLNHPYGASSVKPESTNYYRSFEDVINAYNDSLRTAATPRNLSATTCNAYIILAPAAYENTEAYSNVDLWTKPDSCMCSTINALYGKYQASSLSIDSSFAAYIFRVAGTVMSSAALDSLRNLCNNTLTCNYLVKPISVPPVFQCGVSNVCASCSLVASTYSEFKTKFPGIIPTYDNSDSAQQGKNTLFEKFMNNKLGFVKRSSEYLHFIDTCNGGAASGSCDSLRNILNAYATVRSDGVTFTGDQDSLITNLSAVVQNGAWIPPDSIKNASFPYFYVEQTIRSRANICFDSSYAVEYRFKFPMTTTNLGTDFYITFGNGFDAIFQNRGGADQPGLYLSAVDFPGTIGGCNHWGFYNMADTSSCRTFPANGLPYYLIAAGQNLTDQWTTLKLRVSSSRYQIYCNGNLVFDMAGPPSVSLVGFFAQIAFNRCRDFSIDYIHFYGDDKLIYNEEFNDPSKPAVITSNLCDFTCQDLFAYYFNQQKGSSYSYNQIETMYASCGIPLAVCSGETGPGPMLCGRNQPIFPAISLDQVDNCTDSSFFAISKGTELYNTYADSLRNNFDSSYRAKCLQAYKYESFTVTHAVSEYHYSLYYYDQAGNLLQTVPPEGVDLTVYNRPAYFDSVTNARAAGTLKVPKHKLLTNYRYNTLNQVVAQSTPDAGLSAFWYDRLGRLVISQNARQKAASATEQDRQYSYTTYDYLGRINEVGQVANTSANGAMADTVSRRVSYLYNWLLTLINRKEQVTRTYYDAAYPYTNTIPLNARNLRNRVAYTTLTNGYSTTDYNAASFYSYDIHGNVDTLLQDYGMSTSMATANIMNRNSNRWVRMVYKYDLISGKVNSVAYNPRYYDITINNWVTPINQFFHRYSYDAENRLTTVETSQDSVIWVKDARYEYYRHGPLARMVIGDQLVQGLDYAYTLQGWLKGLNATGASSVNDMGADGKTGGQNINIARDVLGYNLNYYSGDYSAIYGTAPFADPGPQLTTKTAYHPLYNGNISSMAVNIKPFNQPYLYNYTYDQLNRLTRMNTYTGLDTTNNNFPSLTFTKSYDERIKYDGNGNILKYNRYYGGAIMDSLNYYYDAGTNRLNYVKDSSGGGTNSNYKIKNQNPNHYAYDEIGNLIKDSTEFIPSGGIKWNVYGKITEINHSQSGVLFNTKKINYYYDAGGNRIGKRVVKFGTKTVNYTWYVRDAQGNVMSVYTENTDTLTTDTNDSARLVRLTVNDLNLSESHIYGSSRLAMQQQGVSAERNSFGGIYYGSRGNRFYEISNHLGNVLAVITDKKLAHSSNGTTMDYYNPEVVSVTDYYPFGMISRSAYLSGTGLNYRYGFNDKESDNEVKGNGDQIDYGARIYDPRLGRFLSTDPKQKSFPFYSPYQFAGNMPISAIDLDGAEAFVKLNSGTVTKDRTAVTISADVQIKIQVVNLSSTPNQDINLSLIASNLKSDLEEKLSGTNTAMWSLPFEFKSEGNIITDIKTTPKLKDVSITYKVAVHADVSVVNNTKDINNKGWVFAIVDDILPQPTAKDAAGLADYNSGRVAIGKAQYFNFTDFGTKGRNIAAHETLHLLGASDTYPPNKGYPGTQNEQNLMYSGLKGKQLTQEQIVKEIWQATIGGVWSVFKKGKSYEQPSSPTDNQQTQQQLKKFINEATPQKSNQ